MMEPMSVFNGMFGKVEHGMCRLSMSGQIAVKTSNGYKSYNPKSGRLVNCMNFVFDTMDDWFFVIPTNNVAVGDIILVNHKPRCVKEVKDNQITVINYEDSTIETILPERHVFMGNTYFYGKIVSMFGNTNFMKSEKGMNNIMKYMMLSTMMKGNGNNNSGNMNSMLPFMMVSGGMNNMFDGMFNFGEIDEESDDESSDDSDDSEE